MHNHILTLKREFKRDYLSQVTNVTNFISSLRLFATNRSDLNSNNESYWNNYFHATFISAFQELTETNLEKWNDYIT